MRKFFYSNNWRATLEVYKSPSIGASFTINENEDGGIAFHLRFFIQFYLEIQNDRFRKFIYRLAEKLAPKKWGNGGIETGIELNTSHFQIQFFDYNMNETGRTYRFWFSRIGDFFLGKKVFERQTVIEDKTSIVMPEAEYPATYRRERLIQSRKRFPFMRSMREYLEFEIPIGIPHEGKGENSWDMGMDATFGMSSSNLDLHEARRELAIRVLQTRQRHGSLHDEAYLKWFKDRNI